MLDIFRTLPGLLKDLEGAELIREAVVFAAWRRIAGEALAEHAVPLKLENETLSVAVSNITWQRHLKDLCGQMIFKLNAALGTQAVTFIRLQIDEQTVLDHRSKAQKPELDLGHDAEKEVSPELAQAAEAIADDELRRQFLLAAGNCLVRKKTISTQRPLSTRRQA